LERQGERKRKREREEKSDVKELASYIAIYTFKLSYGCTE